MPEPVLAILVLVLQREVLAQVLLVLDPRVLASATTAHEPSVSPAALGMYQLVQIYSGLVHELRRQLAALDVSRLVEWSRCGGVAMAIFTTCGWDISRMCGRGSST